jgi:hypothetical protein
LGGPLSKLCVAPPFSINFTCQIENQVSDKKTIIDSGITKQKDLKLVIQMKCNLEL